MPDADDIRVGLVSIALWVAFVMAPAQVPCDPILENPDGPVPSFVTDPLETDNAIRADGWRMYIRQEGDIDWTYLGGADCQYVDQDGAPIDPDTYVGLVYRWCALDSVGVPPLRYFNPSPGIRYELTATAYNRAGESGFSNVVSWCAASWCEPDLEPQACASN